MFAKWLATQESANWDQLLKALRSQSVQEMTLASRIEQMLGDTNDKYNGKGH